MTRNLLLPAAIIVCLVLAAGPSVATPLSRTELESYRDKALKDSLSPAQLDKMVSRLPQYQEVSKEDLALLFDTYKAICEGYSRNKHQRQAYLLYKQYLSQKERKMYSDLQDTVAKALDAVTNRASNLDEEMKSTGEDADSMITSSENYATLRNYYQRFSALAIILLTILFAISLVRSGVKLNNMRREIISVREHAAFLHQPSTIGRIQPGIRNGQQIAIGKHIELLSQQADELRQAVTNPSDPRIIAALEALAKSESFLKKSLHQN